MVCRNLVEKIRRVEVLIDYGEPFEFVLIDVSHNVAIGWRQTRFFFCEFCIEVEGVSFTFLRSNEFQIVNQRVCFVIIYSILNFYLNLQFSA